MKKTIEKFESLGKYEKLDPVKTKSINGGVCTAKYNTSTYSTPCTVNGTSSSCPDTMTVFCCFADDGGGCPIILPNNDRDIELIPRELLQEVYADPNAELTFEYSMR